MIDQASNVLPQLRAGTIKAFAVTAKERLPSAPDVPTVDEAGLPGLYVSVWHGLWAPKGTPAEIIAKLNGAVVKSLGEPGTKEKLAALGQDIPPPDQLTPQALGAFQKAEIEKWWPIVKEGASRLNDHESRRAAVPSAGRAGTGPRKRSMRVRSSASKSWIARFDAVWLAEHHFTTFSVCPRCTCWARWPRRAKRLRIGTAVSLAAPLPSAEVGRRGGAARHAVGPGQLGRPAAASPIPSSTPSACRRKKAPSVFARLPEIVLRAWTQERCASKVRTSASTASKCAQTLAAAPSADLMAATSETAIDWAASRGFSIPMDPHASMKDLGNKRRRYAQKLTEAGFG